MDLGKRLVEIYNTLKQQLLNDIDTKIIIESEKRKVMTLHNDMK